MNAIADTPLKKEFTITRIINAPREMVFKAWTDPKQLGQWWGPHGFHNPVCEIDARKGGAILIHMASDGTAMPAGLVFPMKGEIVDIVPPSRLVHTNRILEDEHGNAGMEATTTITFAEAGSGKTKLTVHEKVTKLEARAIEALNGFEIGMSQTLDKLETFLGQGTPKRALKVSAPAGQPLLHMSRTFDAPRALVWEAMTKAEHMARWWGPRNYTNKVLAFDVRPGGKWRIAQSDAEGNTFVFHGEYREVVPPARIVQTFGMEGMFDGRVIVETMTLTEKDGRTFYEVTSRFDSVADRDGMVASGMESGANESMERLDELLGEMMAGKA